MIWGSPHDYGNPHFQKGGSEEFLVDQDTMFASRASSCMLGATLKDEAPEEEEVGLGRDGQVGPHWHR